jgi:hypothetical protein
MMARELVCAGSQPAAHWSAIRPLPAIMGAMNACDGWMAIHLEMPKRVPRAEYSVDGHWDLLRAVTGLPVTIDSDAALKQQARRAFWKAWHIDFHWSTRVHREVFGDLCTDMGHAEYAAGGTDWRDTVHCPFTDVEQVLSFDPTEAYGPVDQAAWTRTFEDHYAANHAAHPDAVSMTGIYITMISGFIDIFGWDMLLLAAGTDPQRFGEMANRYAKWVQGFYDALGNADVPVVMMHDDIVWSSGPFIDPAWYRQYIFPNYHKLLRPLIDSGKRIAYTADGDYTMFVDDIAAAGVHGFVMEPMTDMAMVAERYGKTHFFIGNADTRILLTGTKPQIRAEVERCMAIGKQCPGFFMAVGNHIPPNTPVDSALYYNEVYEELSKR